MKQKLILALKNKYKNLGFGEGAFESVADYLVNTVTTDEQVDPAVEGVEGLLKTFQSEVDRRVSSKKEEKKDEPKPEQPANLTPAPEANNDTALKALQEQIATLTQSVSGLAQNQKRKSVEERFKEKGRELKVSEDVLKMFMPTREDEFDAKVADLTAISEKLVKAQSDSNSPGKPDVSVTAPLVSTEKGAVLLKNWMKGREEAVPNTLILNQN